MNISRIALLSFLLCCSSSLRAVPVVWDFMLEEAADNSIFMGSLGYESDQPEIGMVEPIDPEFPLDINPVFYEYALDFIWLQKDGALRREFTDDVTLRLFNDAQTNGGTLDSIMVYAPLDTRQANVISLTTSAGGESPNPSFRSNGLPVSTSDFDYFNPFFDVPSKNRFRSVASEFLDSASLVSLDIHVVPEPNFDLLWLLLPLISFMRAKCLRRLQFRC